ncbi:MAG: putative Surface antigen (D15) precursor, partial [candidate division NC10 bacterium]|nr:putative Surface antigen (D15) precursor [candidate division NC10 bacterium]
MTGFDQDAKGGSLTLGRRLYKELFGSVSYKYEQVRIFNLAANLASDEFSLIKEGTNTTASV